LLEDLAVDQEQALVAAVLLEIVLQQALCKDLMVDQLQVT
jgi:hypothetical protein